MTASPDSSSRDHQTRALELHRKLRGKLSVEPKVGGMGPESLALLYTPGVAAPCLAIAENPEEVYDLTGKGNLVAVISDGSAVLGLGNIGPQAGLPVMEGKALLFKAFAGLDAFPLVLDTQEPDEIVQAVRALAPSFGGINLEDISAPRCFEVETRLQQALDIPVFHDDQHGTAVVVLAGLLNACKSTGRKWEDLRVVVNGAGAAGTAIAKFLLHSGIRSLVVCDREGILRKDDSSLNPAMRSLAERTNPADLKGGLSEALRAAEVFVGVSAPGVLTEDMVRTMAPHAIIFAMANPEPEILPSAALNAGAAVVATGRSDFPNQVNNVLAFPGIFRGALDVRASIVNEEMKLAASRALARLVSEEDLKRGVIIPSAFHPSLAFQVALAVAEAAVRSGVARHPLEHSALVRTIQSRLAQSSRPFPPVPTSTYQEKIGEGLLRLGFIDDRQRQEVLAVQTGGDHRLFGEIALAEQYIEFNMLINYLRDSGVEE